MIITENNEPVAGRKHVSLKGSKLPFERLFDTANARVLDFLSSNEDLDYTHDEISKLAAIPKHTLKQSLQALLREDVIKRTKKGRVFYYTLNLSSPRVKDLLCYVNSTMIDNLDRMSQKAIR